MKIIIRNIIEQNTRFANNNDKLDLIFYYKNLKPAQLIMTNNTNKKIQLNTANVICQFTCPNEDCVCFEVLITLVARRQP